MKPKIDLNDPKVILLKNIMQTQVATASLLPPTVEQAVLPIYHLLENQRRVEQVASGVLVNIKNEYFMLSASHVFDSIGSHVLLLGIGDGTPLVDFKGERFSTGKGISGNHSDDPIDASVFHIQNGLSDSIKRIAISIDDFDLEQPYDLNSVFFAAGFRVSKSKIKGNQANTEREFIATMELPSNSYATLNLDRDTHIAVSYEKRVLVDHRWMTMPKPRGMSGGAIIKASGVEFSTPISKKKEMLQRLTAIIIEHREEKSGKPGALIATRINVHLSLIRHFLPGLLDQDIFKLENNVNQEK